MNATPTPLISCLYRCDVMHQRLRPVGHRFDYRVTSWLIDLDELAELDRRGLLHVNRPGIVSFYERDHGDGSDTPLKTQCQQLLREHGLAQATSVRLLCQPRCLGFGFNSLSVYFCYDRSRTLFATLYEVSNTFGERHTYVIEAEAANSFKADRQAAIEQAANKRMAVSPFIVLAGEYRFRLYPPSQRFSLLVRHQDSQGPLLLARWRGERCELSRSTLWRELLRPPMGLKTLLLIHWQALRLWTKKLAFIPPQKTARYDSSLGRSGPGPKQPTATAFEPVKRSSHPSESATSMVAQFDSANLTVSTPSEDRSDGISDRQGRFESPCSAPQHSNPAADQPVPAARANGAAISAPTSAATSATSSAPS